LSLILYADIGGRLGDAIGRRRLFIIGVAGFTLSSLLCGIAPSIGVLVALRVVQGLSAAMSQPQVLATIHASLDGHRRSRAIGLYASMGGIAASVGQLFGGALVQANIAGLSWRPIFLVNVPVGILVLALSHRFVPVTKSPEPAGVDRLGTALIGIALVSLLVPLTEGRALGWPAWTWLLFALAPAASAAAVYVERRIEHRGGAPLIALAPMTAAFLIGSLVAPRLVNRFGGRVITVAMASEAVVLVALAIQVMRQWPHIGTFSMSPELIVGGFAQAVTLVTLFRTVLADVPHRLSGIGSGVLATVQQAALALGVASLGSLYLSLAGHSPAHAFGVIFIAEAALFAAVAVGGWLVLGGRRAVAARAETGAGGAESQVAVEM
jgi:predicted MFS family arabinose efflux permease